MSLQNDLLPKYKERVKSNQVVTGKCVGSFKERKFIKTCKTVLIGKYFYLVSTLSKIEITFRDMEIYFPFKCGSF